VDAEREVEKCGARELRDAQRFGFAHSALDLYASVRAKRVALGDDSASACFERASTTLSDMRVVPLRVHESTLEHPKYAATHLARNSIPDLSRRGEESALEDKAVGEALKTCSVSCGDAVVLRRMKKSTLRRVYTCCGHGWTRLAKANPAIHIAMTVMAVVTGQYATRLVPAPAVERRRLEHTNQFW
jgi:hypothetical protein